MTVDQYIDSALTYLAIDPSDDYAQRLLRYYYENRIPLVYAVETLKKALRLSPCRA